MRKPHWPLQNPAKTTGTEAQIKAELCQVRERMSVLLATELPVHENATD